MSRRLHLYRDDCPAYEQVSVTSTYTRDELDPAYLVVRPVERHETRVYRVPCGASERQTKLLHEASQALMRDFDRRRMNHAAS
jgi:hypothetical protein